PTATIGPISLTPLTNGTEGTLKSMVNGGTCITSALAGEERAIVLTNAAAATPNLWEIFDTPKVSPQPSVRTYTSPSSQRLHAGNTREETIALRSPAWLSQNNWSITVYKYG